MRKLLTMIFSLYLGTFSVAKAQYIEETMSQSQANATIEKALTKEVTKASKSLNSKIDYISRNYDEGELKALIKNYEKTNRKLAIRQRTAYIPYDRKIDVQNPQKVKRYFRKRVDIIF